MRYSYLVVDITLTSKLKYLILELKIYDNWVAKKTSIVAPMQINVLVLVRVR